MAEISRDLFDPKNRNLKLLFEQGRQLSDADLNEFQDVIDFERREFLKALVEGVGSNKLGGRINNEEFLVKPYIDISGETSFIKITAGTMILDGLFVQIFKEEEDLGLTKIPVPANPDPQANEIIYDLFMEIFLIEVRAPFANEIASDISSKTIIVGNVPIPEEIIDSKLKDPRFNIETSRRVRKILKFTVTLSQPAYIPGLHAIEPPNHAIRLAKIRRPPGSIAVKREHIITKQPGLFFDQLFAHSGLPTKLEFKSDIPDNFITSSKLDNDSITPRHIGATSKDRPFVFDHISIPEGGSIGIKGQIQTSDLFILKTGRIELESEDGIAENSTIIQQGNMKFNGSITAQGLNIVDTDGNPVNAQLVASHLKGTGSQAEDFSSILLKAGSHLINTFLIGGMKVTKNENGIDISAGSAFINGQLVSLPASQFFINEVEGIEPVDPALPLPQYRYVYMNSEAKVLLLTAPITEQSNLILIAIFTITKNEVNLDIIQDIFQPKEFSL